MDSIRTCFGGGTSHEPARQHGRASPPHVHDRSAGRVLPSLLVLGAVIALLGVVWLLRPSRQEAPLAEVPRTALVLQEGRLHRAGQTNAFTGRVVEFDADGALKSRSTISNGVLHGVSEGWHTNGVLQVREEFREGVSHGRRTKWYADGAPLSEAMIADGKLHGTFRHWHSNGALAEEIEMHDGQAEGLSRAYYPSGSLKAQARLQQGKLLEQKFWKEGEENRER